MSSFSNLLLFWALFCVTLISDVYAQTPDTLDPRGYMPLAVGNTWEYEHTIIRPRTVDRPVDESKRQFERYVVLEELIRNDTLFYKLLVDFRDEDLIPLSRDTVLIRYDSSTSSIAGEKMPQIFDWLRCLDADFGTTKPSNGFCWDFIFSDVLEYSELTFSNDPVMIKRFEDFAWGFRAWHGVGIVAGGGGCEPCDAFSDSDHWLLKYAVVDGGTYGAQIVSIESHIQPKQALFTVYPNPAHAEVFVNVSQPGKIEIFDMLGRLVSEKEIRSVGIEKMDLQNYGPGLYVVRLGSEARTLIVR